MSEESCLLVEDDQDFAEELERILRRNAYRVVRAGQLSDGVFKTRNERFSCILLDMHLKGSSGEVILNRIRNDQGDPNHETPIIIISGQLDPKLVERIRGLVQGILVKPFGMKALLEKVKQVLSEKGASAAS